MAVGLNTQNSNSYRDPAIDITRGIGILLMLLGHIPGIHWSMHSAIYSFHMPLFFIVSGYCFRQKATGAVVRSGLKHIVKPYIITAIVCIFLCYTAGDLESVKRQTIAMFMANGGSYTGMFFRTLPIVGPIWFLLAIFWCKIYYNQLAKCSRHTLAWSFAISTAAFIVGYYIVNLPLGILVGACGLVFYAMGDFWHKNPIGKLPWWAYASAIALWLGCIRYSQFEMAPFATRFYIVDMLVAFIGTYFTYLVAKNIPRFIQPALLWLGQNTLLILCYHGISFFLWRNILIYSGLSTGGGYTKTMTENFLYFFGTAIVFTAIHLWIKRFAKLKWENLK